MIDSSVPLLTPKFVLQMHMQAYRILPCVHAGHNLAKHHTTMHTGRTHPLWMLITQEITSLRKSVQYGGCFQELDAYCKPIRLQTQTYLVPAHSTAPGNIEGLY